MIDAAMVSAHLTEVNGDVGGGGRDQRGENTCVSAPPVPPGKLAGDADSLRGAIDWDEEARSSNTSNPAGGDREIVGRSSTNRFALVGLMDRC